MDCLAGFITAITICWLLGSWFRLWKSYMRGDPYLGYNSGGF